MHLAYSTFTCFRETAPQGTLAEWDSAGRPAWYIEGVSAWAAGMVAASRFGEAVQMLGRYWYHYLNEPELSLLARTFDAMGFFGQIEQVDGGMWGNVDAVVRALDSSAAWEAALTGVESNPDFFPAGFFREPLWATQPTNRHPRRSFFWSRSTARSSS